MARRGDRTGSMTAEPEAPVRPCEQPGCPEPAPSARRVTASHSNEYRWFCLEHVRAYNRAWDYYKGMTPGEIERHLREDTGWQRPTWPLGRLGGANPFDRRCCATRSACWARRRCTSSAARNNRGSMSRRPNCGRRWTFWALVGRSTPGPAVPLQGTRQALPPDANGGDRQAEERLKDINRAYSLLRKRLPARVAEAAPAGQPAAG
jgi:hypothetical protein